MSDLTPHGSSTIQNISARYGLSEAAVEHMARAVANGGGSMAQFNVPELGGSGQWMAGGMTMVGDMFNNGLQATVSNLCTELANAQANAPFFTAPQTLSGAAWWPEELGIAASVGGQNQVRYAYFPDARRIAFDPGNGASVTMLDTQDHQIGGFSQQQSGPGDPYMGITFSSQFGQFALSSLPLVGGPGDVVQPMEHNTAAQPPEPEHFVQPDQPDVPANTVEGGIDAAQSLPQPGASAVGPSTAEILDTIGRLAALRDAGALSDEEFTTKKQELLARL